MKGSSLTEAEALAIAQLVTRFDVLLVPVVTDTSVLTAADVALFRDRQCRALVANLTRAHPQSLRDEVYALRDRMAKLPPQLFLQMFASNTLVHLALQAATAWYIVRRPKELHSFVWLVDAKDRSVTAAEDLWRTLLIPWLQNNSRERPLAMVAEADYERYAPFFQRGEDDAGNPLPGVGPNFSALVGHSLTFGDSTNHLGLQIVDNLASLVGRGLNGKIDPTAIGPLGPLLANWDRQSCHFLQPRINQAGPARSEVQHPRWRRIVLAWHPMAKVIWPSLN